jgi:hypothetical protein
MRLSFKEAARELYMAGVDADRKRGYPLQQWLEIVGPLPGMNEMIAAAKGSGGRGRGYATMKLAWTLKVKSEAKGLRPVSRAFLRFTWFESSRRRDPDNVCAAKKFILDGLVAAGVLPKDGWASVAGFSDRWAVDKARPRVEVTIEAMGE